MKRTKKIYITGYQGYDNELANGELAISRSDGKTRYYKMTKSSARRFHQVILNMAMKETTC